MTLKKSFSNSDVAFCPQIGVQLNIWRHPYLLPELKRPVDLCNLHAQRLVQLQVTVVNDVTLLSAQICD